MGFRICTVPIDMVAKTLPLLPGSVRIVGTVPCGDGNCGFLLESPLWDAGKELDPHAPLKQIKMTVDDRVGLVRTVRIEEVTSSPIIIPK